MFRSDSTIRVVKDRVFFGRQQTEAGDVGEDMFEGFGNDRIETSGTTINLVRGGAGPPGLVKASCYTSGHPRWSPPSDTGRLSISRGRG